MSKEPRRRRKTFLKLLDDAPRERAVRSTDDDRTWLSSFRSPESRQCRLGRQLQGALKLHAPGMIAIYLRELGDDIAPVSGDAAVDRFTRRVLPDAEAASNALI